ncbi:hypothetical protein CRYUN_Cryun21dG0000500 [Craigia yunnanensis]
MDSDNPRGRSSSKAKGPKGGGGAADESDRRRGNRFKGPDNHKRTVQEIPKIEPSASYVRVGITFAGIAIGLPANFLFQLPYNSILSFLSVSFLTTTTGALDLARSSGLFSSKITPGLGWNTPAPPVSVLQREATARLSSMLPLLTSSISEGLKRFNGRFFHLRKSQRYAQIFNCCKKDDQIAVDYCIKKDHNLWHHPSFQLFILFLVPIAAVVYSIFYFFSLLDYVCKATLSDLMPHCFRPSALG